MPADSLHPAQAPSCDQSLDLQAHLGRPVDAMLPTTACSCRVSTPWVIRFRRCDLLDRRPCCTCKHEQPRTSATGKQQKADGAVWASTALTGCCHVLQLPTCHMNDKLKQHQQCRSPHRQQRCCKQCQTPRPTLPCRFWRLLRCAGYSAAACRNVHLKPASLAYHIASIACAATDVWSTAGITNAFCVADCTQRGAALAQVWHLTYDTWSIVTSRHRDG
jgi:hypothetical protein